MSTDDNAGTLFEALERVEAHAEPTWLEQAYRCGLMLSKANPTWTADDLWAELEDGWPLLTTHEPRAMGAVVVRLKRAGAIGAEPARYVKSQRAQSHLRPIPVHVSLLFEPAF